MMVTSSVEDCRDSDTALEKVTFFKHSLTDNIIIYIKFNVNNNININIKLIRSPWSLFYSQQNAKATPGSTART